MRKVSYNINFDYLTKINHELGIDIEQQFARNLQLYHEEHLCVDVGLDYYNRNAKMHPNAVEPWQDMVEAAKLDKVELFICSAFRDYAYQAKLIRRKLDSGQNILDIIKVLVPPGFSEHHTGRAVDIITTGMSGVDESFESTEAFKWLEKYAADFSFYMSYPRDNPFGVIYEPWHWCYHFK